ncbi:MAG TPA: DnaD domain protein [Dehalococcoidia bacterium]|nr:DnaD domain protein [Dehalococcoidia bacterium]HIK88105.1 DnaD domain protein [Dehalococcoidia bacterium]
MKDGFPRGVQFTPVPDPLLASLLEEIDSLGELKVVLRAVHALHKQRKVPASIPFNELYSDRTVAAMLGVSGDELERTVDTAVESAIDRGIFLIAISDHGNRGIYLNTEPVRRALARQGIDFSIKTVETAETWPDTEAALPKQDAVTFYEQNIGTVTPIVADNLHAALEEHPEDEVRLAIRKAAEANARSWNYIAAILRRWAEEGRPEELDDGRDGTAERDLQEDRSDQFYEEYLERQRARGAN